MTKKKEKKILADGNEMVKTGETTVGSFWIVCR